MSISIIWEGIGALFGRPGRLLPRSWSEANERRNPAFLADWFTSHFFLAGTVGLLAAAAAARLQHDWASAVRILGLGLLFAGASMVGGWFFGLLFGIPRSLARPRAPAQPEPAPGAPVQGAAGQNAPAPGAPGEADGAAQRASRASTTNTNLEDVSDWLTKTLVGVGLTQLYLLPQTLWRYAGHINENGFQWFGAATVAGPGGPGQLLALAIFMFFAPGGFWLGYIGTRTFLTMWLDGIDHGTSSTADLKFAADPENLKFDPSGDGFSRGDEKLMSTDNMLRDLSLNALTSAQQAAAWAAAQARDKNLEGATKGFEKALRLSGHDPAIRQQLAKVLVARKMPDRAERLIGDAISGTALLRALYEAPPIGFTKAIQIGEALIERPEGANDANVHVWLAAAYGQKLMHEKPPAGDPRLAEIKGKLIAQVKAALALEPRTKGWMYSLWKPAPGSEENDLSAIPPDDAELRALLG